jgi:hypothetical protein
VLLDLRLLQKKQGGEQGLSQFVNGERDPFFQSILTSTDIESDPKGHKSGRP